MANRYSIAHRARLFRQLSELEKSGEGGFDQVFKSLGEGGDAAEQAELDQLAEQFRSGQTALLDALKQSHGFLPWELPLIELGLATGNVQSVYLRLAEHYMLLGGFLRDLKRHAWPPLLLVLLGGVALPGSIYLTGGMPLWECLLRALAAPLMLLAGWGGLRAIYRAYQRNTLPRQAIDVIYKLPGMRHILGTALTYHFLCNMSLCLNSGLELAQSLKLAARHLPYSPLKARYQAIHRQVSEGARLSRALGDSGVLRGVAMRRMAPGAGAQQAHRHITDAVHETLLEMMAYWARWLPQGILMLVPVLLLLQLL